MRIESRTVNTPAVTAFVDTRPEACQGHRPAWLAVMRRGLGHQPTPLSAWRDGQVVGYLPLVLARSTLFGRRLVSLPYVSEAGVLAEDESIAAALVERAHALAAELGADQVELRHRQPLGIDELAPVRRDKGGMTLALAADEQAMWQTIPSKVRNQIRKARKQRVDCRVGGAELLDAFFAVFAQNMRDLGTPVLPKRLFRAMLHQFGPDAELVLAEHDGRVAAGAVLIHGPGVTEVPSASSLRRFNHTNANMALYWRLVNRAIERGSAVFDFGRCSEGSGPHRFKKQWGAQPHSLGWQSLGLGRSTPAPTREDDRFSVAIALWKRLPVCVCRCLGPSIARCLC